MKIVIDIPEPRYHSLQECAVAVTDDIHKAVLNGKPYEERKTGRWIEHDDFDNSWECSACNEVVDIIEGTPMDNEYRFCPWCGAKMEGAE